MTALTSVFFTPFYCAAFLSGLTLLEGKGMQAVRERLEKDYMQLTKATVGTWSVFNCFLFSCVEFDNRVTVAMTAHFVYLIVLALWNEGVFSAKAAPAAADTSAEAEENAFPQIAFDLPPPTEEELQDVMLAGPGLALTDEMEPVDFEQLAEDVDDFVQEVGDKVNGVGQHVLEAVEEAGEAVEHFGEKVTAMVEDMVEDMVETDGGPGSVAGEGKSELESAPRRRDDVREKRAAEQDT